MTKALIQGKSMATIRLMRLMVACAIGFLLAASGAETSLILDFAKGLPAGGTLREMGQIGPQGLGATILRMQSSRAGSH